MPEVCDPDSLVLYLDLPRLATDSLSCLILHVICLTYFSDRPKPQKANYGSKSYYCIVHRL